MSRTEPYTGPFPRKRHSHKCLGCAAKYGQRNAVGCYKQHCTQPQTTETCGHCSQPAMSIYKVAK